MLLPLSDEIEVTVFGPGLGECILVHLGGGKWVCVDSCLDPTSAKPAVLAYFDALGIDPSRSLRLIVVTHWHNDHIRGLSRLVDAAPNAELCFPDAMTTDEFLSFVGGYVSLRGVPDGSGVGEFCKTLEVIHARKSRHPNLIGKDRCVLRTEGSPGVACEVWSLSPSDKQKAAFFAQIAGQKPAVRKTGKSAAADDPNHLSAVLFIRIGNDVILLGADLENHPDPELGWDSIINRRGGPAPIKALYFKVPHHGSSNAHNENVWEELLAAKPIAVVTPYSRLTHPLPTKADRVRILGKTDTSYCTSQVRSKDFKSHEAAVQRTLKESGAVVRQITDLGGYVTTRWQIGSDATVTLSGSAYKIA